MNALTIEVAESQLKALAEQLIQKLRTQHAPVLYRYPAADIQLLPGEHYAGPVLDADGKITHHLVQMAATSSSKLDWQAAMDWAASVGGALPTSQEQALLFANCKPHLQPVWHWSSEQHEDDASYAWLCTFTNGFQFHDLKSAAGSAVAVRRVAA
jgi:hypothetical protein